MAKYLSLLLFLWGSLTLWASDPWESPRPQIVFSLNDLLDGKGFFGSLVNPAKDDPKREYVWERGDIWVPYLKLNNLRFTNRARCALDAQMPAQSVSMIIDSMNAAKLAYRLGLATGKETKQFTEMAVRRFRFSLLELTKLIAEKLIAGKLPLLPHDNTSQALRNYKQIILACRQDEYCEQLDEYIKDLWLVSSKRSVRAEEWRLLDNFSSSKHFIKPSKALEKNKNFEFSCYHQLQFSSLQSQLAAPRPTKEILTEIAATHVNQDQFLERCDEMYRVRELDFASYQLELLHLQEDYWKQVGFDFWHSLKLYLSWAYRYSAEITEWTYPFHNVFKSIHLEDSLMMLSNDCRSITEPRCDQEFLSEQNIRKFALKAYEDEMSSYDQFKFLPDGVSRELLEEKRPDINDNVLDFDQFDSMAQWGKNFRDNFTRTRGIMKGRLLRGSNALSLIANNLTPTQIIEHVKKLKEGSASWVTPYKNELKENQKRNQLYYLCSEYNMMNMEILHFKDELATLREIKSIDPLISNLTDKKLADFYDYYQRLAQEVTGFCQQLEKNEGWGETFELDQRGFASWMKELMQVSGELPNEKGELIKGSPLLSYAQFEYIKTPENVICYHGVDCARKVLEAMINIYSVSKYVDTYFAPLQQISSPSLNNPYAERTVCQVYDPWWRMKKSFFDLFNDLTWGAISVINTTPFYIDVDLKEKNVVSFNQLLQDGAIKLEPQFDKDRLLLTLGAEFGPLLGTSCGVAISNNTDKITGASTRSYFAGITVGACTGTASSSLTVSSTSDMSDRQKTAASGCITCTLNFANVAEELSEHFNMPIINSGFYLARGIARFVEGMLDPVDVPHSWEVNVNHVLETFRRYGDIPKRCVGALGRGVYCLDDRNQYLAAATMQLFNSSVTAIAYNGAEMDIESNDCRYPLFNLDIRQLEDYLQRGELMPKIVNSRNCRFRGE